MQTIENVEVNIKDNLVQIENLLNLNVPEENRLKIEQKNFSSKIEKFQFYNFSPKHRKIFSKVLVQTIEDIEVNIKDNLVRIENLLNLNVPEENKFKIEKKSFGPKIEKFQFYNFLPKHRKIFSKVLVQTIEDIEVNKKR